MNNRIDTLSEKRQFISRKIIIGIDPAKDKHQVRIIDSSGIPLGKTFSFRNDYNGYHIGLWKKLGQYLDREVDYKTAIVFAVESACDLWQPLVHYLFTNGYLVVRVSPLATYYARVICDNSFSKTDPKDALVIANNAAQGNFTIHTEHDTGIRSMRTLSITSDKLRKDYVKIKNRIVSFVKRYFPEFIKVLNPDTLTARYLLKQYFLPKHFLSLDIEKEAAAIMSISKNQHGQPTLLLLKQAAAKTIGVNCTDDVEEKCLHLTLNAWLNQLDLIEDQAKQIRQELIRLARQYSAFSSIKSLKGVSDQMAALFVAETRALKDVRHYKQVQKMAGTNLRLNTSGRYHGRNRISHLGNSRLRWLLFMMAKETVKYVPEIRIKYLKRQLKKRNYLKNTIACTSKLLQLILSLTREERLYKPHLNPELEITCQRLDREYENLKRGRLMAA